jgi:hypothetical protein
LNGIELKKKKSVSSTLIRYIFGVFFLLLSVANFSSSLITGLLFLLAGIVAIPPMSAQFERKLNISMSGTVRFFVVFLLVIVASASLPPIDSTTALNNSTDVIAEPLTLANGTTTTAMPASTEIPEVSTTSDNKGLLNILTSPTGATVAVDGVSQGLSPVTSLSLDQGKHTVDLYLSGYNPKTLTVYITSSDTKTVSWTFTPYTNSNSTSTKTSEVTPTSDSAKAQVTTSDSNYNKVSNANNTNSESDHESLKSTSKTTSNTTSTNTASDDENSKLTSKTTSNVTNTDSKLIYASSKSNVYHAAGCKYVQRIKPENLITFNSRKDAEKAGYKACKVCGG